MALADRPVSEQVALRYCGPRGIPLSEFFDRWTQNDRLAALDWQEAEDLKCPGCGQPRTECMANEDEAPKYKAEVLRCHACQIGSMEGSDIDDKTALYTFVRKAG